MLEIYDRGYKKLFSNKTLFRQLLQYFVPFEWVKELDFEHCELLDKTFISKEYQKRESDVIYKVQLLGRTIYIVILIEFQSSPDKFMALRILHYITSFYMRLKDSDEKCDKLPPIFPIVLYNGKEPWTAPTNIKELIENNELLGEFSLDFKYFKIAENETSVEQLLEIGNAVSTLFLGEAHFDARLLAKSLSKLRNQENRLVISLLLNYFEQLYRHHKLGKAEWEQIDKELSDKEIEMSLESIEEYFVKVHREGIREGELKGKVEGKLEGKLEIAKTMLSRGLDVNLILELTDLSTKDIEQLMH
jgi:predicted transposase/invertase (TIGR01784 family)